MSRYLPTRVSRRWQDLFRAMLWRVRCEGVLNLLATPLLGSITLLALIAAIALIAPGSVNDAAHADSFTNQLGYQGHSLAMATSVLVAPGLTALIVTTSGLRVVRSFASSEPAVELNELLLAAGIAPADILTGGFVFLLSVAVTMALLTVLVVGISLVGATVAFGGTLAHMRATYWLMLVVVPATSVVLATALASVSSLLRPDLVRPSRRALVAGFTGGETTGMAPALALVIVSLLVGPAQLPWLLAAAVLIAVGVTGVCIAVGAALVRPDRML